MNAFVFEKIANALPTPGLALQLSENPAKYWRITHVFSDVLYVIPVTTVQGARDACRPMEKTFAQLDSLHQKGACWGRLSMPDELSTPPQPGGTEELNLSAAWNMIEPLVGALEHRENLDRGSFQQMINARAAATECTNTTVRRTLLRYYYFGRSKLGLLPLSRGQVPLPLGRSAPTTVETKRRGRTSVLARNKFGRNQFVVSEDDIKDMVSVLKSQLTKGRALYTEAHETYLSTLFAKRHPKVYTDWVAQKCEEPVTYKQFYYHVDKYARLEEDLAKNLRTHKAQSGFVGSVAAPGPGMFEIDATGGRLYLVSSGEKLTVLRRPTIYLVIDRWSRYIVSAYISVNAPSVEEVRQPLLIAFTSRTERFSNLGINVDDVRWPVGKMPWAIVTDRGSEFMSEQFAQMVADDLRIEHTPLPPATPDGKAVVERMIRTLKQRMANSGLKGTFADRIEDHDTKQIALKAKAAAIHTLAEAYRELIDIVVEHNNRPHKTLQKYKELAHAGIPPTPSAAYQWGIANLTGLRAPTQNDEYYRRKLMAFDKATLSNRVLRYRGGAYEPHNEAAVVLVANIPKRAKQVDIRLDKNSPFEISIVTSRNSWAVFRIVPGSLRALSGTTLDEIDVFAESTALLNAEAASASRIDRVVKKATRSEKPILAARKNEIETVGKRELNAISDAETARMKVLLSGGRTLEQTSETTLSKEPLADWQTIDAEEIQRRSEYIKQFWDQE